MLFVVLCGPGGVVLLSGDGVGCCFVDQYTIYQFGVRSLARVLSLTSSAKKYVKTSTDTSTETNSRSINYIANNEAQTTATKVSKNAKN